MLQYKPWSRDVLDKMTKRACENGFSCLDLELGGACPYSCVYCETPNRKQKAKINIDKVCSFIETGQIEWIYICGVGESTFGENEEALLKILESCKRYGAKCSIFSNMSNLSELLEEYIKDEVLYILFKFDSMDPSLLKKIYNLNDIETHLNNIEKLTNLVVCKDGVTNIAASIVPTKYNVSEIPQLVEWCLNKNIYPLVAQLEYAGAAKDIYDELVLDDSQLRELKAKIEDILGEEYKVPFCPSLIAGICITYNNEVTIDSRTGLSCHSFWLEDPIRDVICDSIDVFSIEEIADRLVNARNDRYRVFKKLLSKYILHTDVFGGCGGNKKDVFGYYIKTMDQALSVTLSKQQNLRINRFVYLDNNATTKVSTEVKEAMMKYFENLFINPNSKTMLGRDMRKVIEDSRKIIANSINCNPINLFFTCSGSEGNSWAIHNCLVTRPDKKIIISTEIEHDSIINYLTYLKEYGYEIYNIPTCENGQVDVDALLNNPPLWNNVCFATVMYVNNETGVINDIKKITKIMHDYSIPVHCDAVQAFGKIKIDVKDLDVDYLSISGHKVHAPKGIGALYTKNPNDLFPIIHGDQEGGKRGGTENVAYIAGFAKAVKLAYTEPRFSNTSIRIQTFRNEIEQRVKDELKDVVRVVINGENAPRVANTSNMGFENIDAIRLSLLLEKEGIQVSNGSACFNGDPRYSHVLNAMKSPSCGKGAIRISLSYETEHRDIDYFVDNLVNQINKYGNVLK